MSKQQFTEWAAAEGHDTAHTYDTDRSCWVFFNPMTADLWKCWQAAHADSRFFMDHGMWHDRQTGQHLYTEDQYRQGRRDALQEHADRLREAEVRAACLGGTAGVSGRSDETFSPDQGSLPK